MSALVHLKNELEQTPGTGTTVQMVLGGVLIAVLFERVSPELRGPTAEIVAAAR
ncbi:hypothetical protein [Acrocarpospora sp. B8E8]|uniref:hypothetical protein n=1 Tax=Acrocarpospora sp. B8E8 TaxID=3153572 RepID=UPI00325CF45F